MKRQKVLKGYEVVDGVIFAKYQKQIVEDDESITFEGIHRETITQEAYDALKLSEFINNQLLDKAKEISEITVAKNEKEAELASVKSQLASKDQELAQVKATLQSKEALLVSKK